jgi:hypothetical protein
MTAGPTPFEWLGQDGVLLEYGEPVLARVGMRGGCSGRALLGRRGPAVRTSSVPRGGGDALDAGR